MTLGLMSKVPHSGSLFLPGCPKPALHQVARKNASTRVMILLFPLPERREQRGLRAMGQRYLGLEAPRPQGKRAFLNATHPGTYRVANDAYRTRSRKI